MGLTRAVTATDSNVPLLPIAGAHGFAVEFFPGTKWYLSAVVPQAKALVYDPSAITAVLRSPASIDLDPFYGYASGEVALRSYVRADCVVHQPAAVAVIAFA